MDKILEKKPWYIRYRWHLITGAGLTGLFVYALSLSMGPSRMRVDEDSVKIGKAQIEPFLEYVDVEGLVQPITTLKVNTREGGNAYRILAEEGQTLHKGDTILIMTNPELQQTIDDQYDYLLRQQTTYQEQQIEQEKSRLSLKRQTLQTKHEMERLEKSIIVDREENRMGVKSNAQLEIAEDEYRYNLERTLLEMESLRNDSTVAVLRGQMLARDLENERKKYSRSLDRLADLVVLAPCDGQLSYLNATPGQRIGAGEAIAEIKVLTDFKVHASLNEYYIDRITSGLPATIKYQNSEFPLHITRVLPEVRNRAFDINLVFENSRPDNIRVGKSYRIKIELGKAEDALIIPRGDFYQATLGQWIYKVDKDGKSAVRVPITIGRQNPSQYEVISGLEPGDQVIVTGYDRLSDSEIVILQ